MADVKGVGEEGAMSRLGKEEVAEGMRREDDEGQKE